MLLYPGESRGNEFLPFETDDYQSTEDNGPNRIQHQCKMGFVHVLNEDGELAALGQAVLEQLGILN